MEDDRDETENNIKSYRPPAKDNSPQHFLSFHTPDPANQLMNRSCSQTEVSLCGEEKKNRRSRRTAGFRSNLFPKVGCEARK